MSQQGKPAHSGKLMQLRFMQRAAEKRKLEEAVAKQQEEQHTQNDDEQPQIAVKSESGAAAPSTAATVPTQPAAVGGQQQGAVSTSGRCIVTYEPIPLPGAACGRMSFKGFNPATERLQAERAGVKPAPPKPAASEQAPQAGVSVSDAQMAAQFRKPAELKSWAPSELKVYGEDTSATSSRAAAPGAVLSLSGGAALGAAAGSGGHKEKKIKKEKTADKPPAENMFAPLRPAKKPKVTGS